MFQLLAMRGLQLCRSGCIGTATDARLSSGDPGLGYGGPQISGLGSRIFFFNSFGSPKMQDGYTCVYTAGLRVLRDCSFDLQNWVGRHRFCHGSTKETADLGPLSGVGGRRRSGGNFGSPGS